MLKIDNDDVRRKQIERINATKADRNEDACQAALQALTLSAETGEGNLLALSVEAAK